MTSPSPSGTVPVSPLLTGDGPLDERQRAVVARVADAERASILALPSDAPLDPKRRARVAATSPEMLAQPDAVRATWDANGDTVARLADDLAGRLAEGRLRRVHLVGAGDSLAVMIGARLAFERLLGVPCEPVQSLEFAYYLQHVDPSCAVLALSSSGETTRTVEAALVAQAGGAFTVAVTNSPQSTLAAESSTVLHVRATRVGWPTQSSTAALALLLRLAVEVGLRRGVRGAQSLSRELLEFPAVMAAVLADADADVSRIAAEDAAARMTLFAAGGPTFAAAVMGAAKVKECTPFHALAVQVEEYHHYNSQKAGEPLWLLAPTGRTVPRAVDTGHDAKRWGGRLHVVTTVGQRAFDLDADDVLELPEVAEEFSALLHVLPAQLAAYHLASVQFERAERA